MSEKTVMDYALASYQCSCGHWHQTDIRELLIADQAFSRLPHIIRQQQVVPGRLFDPKQDTLLLAADENTWKAAGQMVYDILESDHLKVSRLIFPGSPDLVPDEKAVFEVLAAIEESTTLLISVGSGTLNDLVRFVSFKSRRPYICVATAPSMDGYASSVAPMIQNNLKTTYEIRGAAALLAQPDILAGCPDKMLAAGLGDILGKYTALADWHLGRIVEDEYFCGAVHDLVRKTADLSLAGVAALARRDLSAVCQVMDGLLMTGIAMSYAGNSRPASGAEHHLSHFWEMKLMQNGQPPVLHGAKVGLATPLVCRLYQKLADLKPDFAAARARAAEYDFTKWSAGVRQAYGSGAAEVIALQQKTGKNSPERTIKRIDSLEKNWSAILEVSRLYIPDPAQLSRALLQAGGPENTRQINIKDDWVIEGIANAADMRDRFTILQLYNDLQLLDEAYKLAFD